MDLKTFLSAERGRASRMAEALGVTPVTVHGWAYDKVPSDRCPVIERLTHGAVRCEDLRPDVEWSVLRCQCDQQTQEAA